MTTSTPQTVAALIGARDLADDDWLTAIRDHVVGLAPTWSGSVGLAALFDQLALRMRARQLAAQLPPFMPQQLRQLALLARRLDAPAPSRPPDAAGQPDRPPAADRAVPT